MQTQCTGRTIPVAGVTADLDGAMFEAAWKFADSVGLPHDEDEEVIAAALRPVSMAYAFYQLCQALEVPTPHFVRRAVAIQLAREAVTTCN